LDKIVIHGGHPLEGEIEISGSKNSALPCLFATLLTDDECVLHNVPDLVDIDTTLSLLIDLGKKVERKSSTVTVTAGKKLQSEAPYELVRKMRASALVLGPLLARLGFTRASLPGGCAIGVRPIDIHIDGFKALGAQTSLVNGMVEIRANQLLGRKIHFKFPSVGATENLLMAASLAKGVTTLENVAREPEIVDLVHLLQKMGAKIEGAGTSTIEIHGSEKLKGAEHVVIPDRIETATYLIAAAITRGDILLKNTQPIDVQSILKDLARAGVKINLEKSTIRCSAKKLKLKPLSVVTGPYPKFPTDVQAQWMALMSLAGGKCSIREKIFESRHLHASELCRMGANIQMRSNQFLIEGVSHLEGAHVMVSDLRAGAALVLAGLAARGTTVIHRVYHLDRGYENLELKLKKLGANIKRIH